MLTLYFDLYCNIVKAKPKIFYDLKFRKDSFLSNKV